MLLVYRARRTSLKYPRDTTPEGISSFSFARPEGDRDTYASFNSAASSAEAKGPVQPLEDKKEPTERVEATGVMKYRVWYLEPRRREMSLPFLSISGHKVAKDRRGV